MFCWRRWDGLGMYRAWEGIEEHNLKFWPENLKQRDLMHESVADVRAPLKLIWNKVDGSVGDGFIFPSLPWRQKQHIPRKHHFTNMGDVLSKVITAVLPKSDVFFLAESNQTFSDRIPADFDSAVHWLCAAAVALSPKCKLNNFPRNVGLLIKCLASRKRCPRTGTFRRLCICWLVREDPVL
jgi:hypothetical protein